MSTTDPEATREWERVQHIERAYHEHKDPERILPVNLQYWSRVLGALPPGELSIGPQTRVLDVGCGGAGILLGLDRGVLTGIDPLMPFYLEKFPFLARAPVRWLEGTAEDLAPGELFDVIFSINMLDHTIEPRRAAGNIARLLAPGGRLILVLNVHLARFWRGYFARLYRFVDPPHPHHIHRDDVPCYFPDLELRSSADVDHLWLDLVGFYEQEVLHKKARDRGKLVRKLLNPFLYPLAAARLIARRPVHRRRREDRPLMPTVLFVFARPA